MGTSLVLAARSMVIERGGVLRASGINPGRNDHWAPLNQRTTGKTLFFSPYY